MFPKIETIQDIYPAINGRDEFKVNKRNDIPLITVDYYVNFADTFPAINTDDEDLNNLYRMRRECRGIKFHADGRIASRPYHKFFNIGERPETMVNQFLWHDFVIMDKMDGSMIDAVMIDGQIYLGTKAGPTEIAIACQQWVQNNNPSALDLCRDLIKDGVTPLFEWCAPSNRIVVAYNAPKLVLTGAREMNSGEYINYNLLFNIAEKYGVPIVETWEGSPKSLKSFIDEAVKRENEEGFVISWSNGVRAKIKNEWYCQLHSAKDLMSREKDVILLVLNSKVDDAKPFMTDNQIRQIDEFTTNLHASIRVLEDKVYEEVTAWINNNGDNQKAFAVEFVEKSVDRRLKGLYYGFKSGKEIGPMVIDMLKSYCSSGPKLETIRDLIGVRWDGLEYQIED